MLPSDPVLLREIPVIRKIIQDETWLEGERRGCHVMPDDRVVRENVCRVILQVGEQLRASITQELPPGAAQTATTTNTQPTATEALDWEI